MLYMRVKGQLYCYIIMFCQNTCVAIILHHSSGTEGHIVIIKFTQTLILGTHLETFIFTAMATNWC